MLRELSPHTLWVAEIPFVTKGFDLGARMTVIRLCNGELFVCSPITLSDPLRTQLEALGQVRSIVSPNKFHFLDLPDFARAYPKAKVYVSPGADGKTMPGLPPREKIAGAITLRDAPEPEWADDIDQLIFGGMPAVNEVIFYHRPSKTLILTDLCFYFDETKPPLTRLLARMLGVYNKFGPSLTIRKFFMRDHQAARRSVERILTWDFDRIIIAHGCILETGGKVAFRQAFAFLLR